MVHVESGGVKIEETEEWWEIRRVKNSIKWKLWWYKELLSQEYQKKWAGNTADGSQRTA